MRRTDLAAAALCVLVFAGGCVSALREPPSLEDLASGSASSAGPFAEAERLWVQRTLPAVTRAAEIYQASITENDVRLEALIGAARARLWIADHHEEPEVRLDQAEQAVALGQWCGRVDADEPECDYLLALALGLQAQERRSTAIDALPRIIDLLRSVAEREPGMDAAGPHRVLALVYLRSPGWPAGPGDVDLGLEAARKALELAPDHPPNHMALGEARRELRDYDASREAYREALRLAQQAVSAEVPDAAEWRDLAAKALERLEQR